MDRTVLINKSNHDTIAEIVIEPNPKYRTLDGIKDHPLYQSMSPGQQKFLDAFLATSDRVTASRASGEFVDEISARNSADRHLRNWKIRLLISTFRGKPIEQDPKPMPKQELEFLIGQRLRSEELPPGIFAELAYQLITLRGWVPDGVPVRGRLRPDKRHDFETVIEREKHGRPPKAPSDVFLAVQQLEEERRNAANAEDSGRDEDDTGETNESD